MDMFGAGMPIIQPRVRAVLYWGDAGQPLDFTTRADTAAYTAAAVMDAFLLLLPRGHRASLYS